MLAIGRALMAKRACCCSMSLPWASPNPGAGHFQDLAAINRSGLTVLLVEQNVRQALKIAAMATSSRPEDRARGYGHESVARSKGRGGVSGG